jgi:glycosyltransferase involved in cell wall biosynthesis
VARVARKDRIQVRIIGEGDFSDGLRQIIADHNLQGVIEFDNRNYPVYQIPDRIADCHVGLVPLEISSITNYALPLKLLEYVSMGLPVITVRSAAITYYFGEEECLFYQWDDVESLRQVIDDIVANPEVISRSRQRVAKIRDRFLWSHQRDKYVTLLHELVGTK